ncbi:hypothetical protein Ancab_030394 [Ancistrocladus abbreviatus]
MEGGPTIMVTNDDGIDASCLRALVRALVSTNRYDVRVCAPDTMGWRQVTSGTEMDVDLSTCPETDSSAVSAGNLLFKREVIVPQLDETDIDAISFKEGYISVTPLNALSNADADCHTFFGNWLPRVVEQSSSAL